MKWMLILFVLGLFSCSTKNPVTGNNPVLSFNDQEATIQAHVISRGKFQYVISVEKGDLKGNYLPEELDQAYCQDGLKVKFDAELLEKSGIIYQPGPTDIPEKAFEAPMVKVLSISKM